MAEQEKKSWMAKHRRWTIGVGLLLVIVGPVLLLAEQESHAGWAAMFAGLIFMVASRFEDVQEIGLASFRMKMFERRVDQLEGVVRDIKRLAKESSRLALASIQFSGRMGGFTDDYKTRVLADTRRLLNELDVTPEEIAEVESLWHAAVEFDYTLWATGLNTVPKDLPQHLETNWNILRGDERGIEGRSTPQEIRTFLSDADMLTPEREEILKDYEHYIGTRQHRREDVWRRRR
jgi:hypothetical protein